MKPSTEGQDGFRLPSTDGEGRSPAGCHTHSGKRCYARKNIVTALLKQKIESTIFEDLEERLQALDEKNTALQMQLIVVSGDREQEEPIQDEMDILRKERQGILAEAAARSDLKERMNDMISFLDKMPQVIAEYSDAITRRLVEKITIFDEKIVVEPKSGLMMEVEE